MKLGSEGSTRQMELEIGVYVNKNKASPVSQCKMYGISDMSREYNSVAVKLFSAA